MGKPSTRRRFLTAGVAGSLASIAGCSAIPPNSQTTSSSEQTSPAGTTVQYDLGSADYAKNLGVVDVRGAIYLPAKAFNFYQQWANYDRKVIERDLGYATKVNLNAIRTWSSFELWHEDPQKLEKRLDHFLSAAEERGQKVLMGLFDFAGAEPTKKRLHNTNPQTATGVRSPSSKVMRRKSRWGEPREYVKWFMERYRDDDRLLAIEAMNEPGWRGYVMNFAKSMFRTMKQMKGSVPLTVGSTSMANNADYLDWGCDALQFHYNFAENREVYREMLRSNRNVADELDVPVYLSEWQRIRAATGFNSEPPEHQKVPNYASVAPLIHRAGFGNFFWSLMLQPAFVPAQRKFGILNGLFHEDGAVWSLRDAKAIMAMSGEVDVSGLQERQQWPKWASGVKNGT